MLYNHNNFFRTYINLFRIMHIKKLIDRVVYILQAGEIREHCHLISVYQVHIKLPYLLLNGSVDVSYPIPLCSIYSNSSHVEWLAGSSNIILEADILRMIRPNFGLNWPSGSWGEQKSIQPTPNDGKISQYLLGQAS